MGARPSLIEAYEVLGVRPDASQAELKAAHRRLVRRHHPDLVPPEQRPEATRRVQHINVAYGLVRDEERRASYDRLRAAHRARDAVASVDSDLAGRWEDLLEQAGRWAGVWWSRNRRRVERSAVNAALMAERAGRALFGTVVWLAFIFVGALAGTFVALAAGQVVTGEVGALTPVAGALAGSGVGSDRGRRKRRRIARLPPPSRPAVVMPLVALVAIAAAVAVDAALA